MYTEMQKITRVLANARSLYNMIRLLGHYDLLEKADFQKLNFLHREANNHLTFLNLKEHIENDGAYCSIAECRFGRCYFYVSQKYLKKSL